MQLVGQKHQSLGDPASSKSRLQSGATWWQLSKVAEIVNGDNSGWFQCRCGGFWMSSYGLMFPGVKSSLVFSGFGLKPPASGFQSYSYSSLKTSPSIQYR